MRLVISGVTESIASRVRSTGRVVDLMASDKATEVAEFLETSPTIIVKSAESRKSFKSGDLSIEPDSVAGRKVMSGSGGTLDFREAGKRKFSFLIGKVLDKNSAVWTTVEKLLEFPPTILSVPDFCSGIFHSRSLYSLRSGFLIQ